ncbi:MAG: prepilin-type N-terminal cleavage/methylation domain-containing protein [candidate division WS1 bacterium]|nr:prepilin-type N-terminal cleavage/methylation domain-containing protein [candidate division WS1 bacterium]
MTSAKRLPIRQGHRSQGMTLLELMVAMLVLLVGIWTIAVGFPRLLANITNEQQRTEMARLAERNMERLKGVEGALCWAVSGDPTISPFSVPEDFDDVDRPANAQENMLDVIGETFRIPASQPQPDGLTARASSVYVLQQGPAQWCNYPEKDSYPFVYILIPLTEQRVDPREPDYPMLANSFFVDEQTGKIVVPDTVHTYDGSQSTAWNVDELLVNYAWASTGSATNRPPIHHVQDERAIEYEDNGSLLTYSVRPTARTTGAEDFVCLLEGKTSVQALVYFAREDFDYAENSPSARGRYILDNDFGAYMRFHRDDAGLTTYVDYRLRDVHDTNGLVDEQGRRKLLMIEDHLISSETMRTDEDTGSRYTDIKLAAGNLDDDLPLFEFDLGGIDLTTPVYLLAVDLTTGETHVDGENLALADTTLSPALHHGFRDGMVSVRLDDAGVLRNYVGHTWRFYYSTLDHHSVQLQRPPRSFVDLATAECYTEDFLPPGADPASNLVQVDYRTYQVIAEYDTNIADMDRIALEFVALTVDNGNVDIVPSAAMEGHAVSVDYIWYDADDQPHAVYGEMHTVPAGSNRVVLQHLSFHRSDDYPSAEIMAVRGVSARTIVWWLTGKGRQQQVAIDSYMLKGPLGFVQRIR